MVRFRVQDSDLRRLPCNVDIAIDSATTESVQRSAQQKHRKGDEYK